jgi:hypothetical protein
MSFEFILQKFAYVDSFSFSTSTASDFVLYSAFLSPLGLMNFNSRPWGEADYMTPLCYLANFARYFRGDLVMKLKFVKTPYHQCRIKVVFIPGPHSSLPNPDPATEVPYCHLDVIDISESTEYTFRFPFTCSTPYLDPNDYYGCVIIYLVNPLRCPDTVANSVNVLVEWAAAPGFELAGFYEIKTTTESTPYPISDPTGSDPELLYLQRCADHRIPLKPQAARPPSSISDAPRTIGGAVPSVPSMTPAELCIGERITSIRQLVKRQTATMTTPPAAGYNFKFRPHFITRCYWDGAALQFPYGCHDTFAKFAQMYAFYRGGVNIRIDPTSGSGSYRAWLSLDDNTAGAFLTSATDTFATASGVVPFYNGHGVTEFRAPYMSQVPMQPVRPITTTYIPLFDIADRVSVEVINDSSSQARVYRGGSDDCQFAYFLGVPPQTYQDPTLSRARQRRRRQLQISTPSVPSAALGQPSRPPTLQASSLGKGVCASPSSVHGV